MTRTIGKVYIRDGNYPYSIDDEFSLFLQGENYEQYWFDWESYTYLTNMNLVEKAYQSVLAYKSVVLCIS